jgi:hypothetical protein
MALFSNISSNQFSSKYSSVTNSRGVFNYWGINISSLSSSKFIATCCNMRHSHARTRLNALNQEDLLRGLQISNIQSSLTYFEFLPLPTGFVHPVQIVVDALVNYFKKNNAISPTQVKMVNHATVSWDVVCAFCNAAFVLGSSHTGNGRDATLRNTPVNDFQVLFVTLAYCYIYSIVIVMHNTITTLSSDLLASITKTFANLPPFFRNLLTSLLKSSASLKVQWPGFTERGANQGLEVEFKWIFPEWAKSSFGVDHVDNIIAIISAISTLDINQVSSVRSLINVYLSDSNAPLPDTLFVGAALGFANKRLSQMRSLQVLPNTNLFSRLASEYSPQLRAGLQAGHLLSVLFGFDIEIIGQDFDFSVVDVQFGKYFPILKVDYGVSLPLTAKSSDVRSRSNYGNILYNLIGNYSELSDGIASLGYLGNDIMENSVIIDTNRPYNTSSSYTMLLYHIFGKSMPCNPMSPVSYSYARQAMPEVCTNPLPAGIYQSKAGIEFVLPLTPTSVLAATSASSREDDSRAADGARTAVTVGTGPAAPALGAGGAGAALPGSGAKTVTGATGALVGTRSSDTEPESELEADLTDPEISDDPVSDSEPEGEISDPSAGEGLKAIGGARSKSNLTRSTFVSGRGIGFSNIILFSRKKSKRNKARKIEKRNNVIPSPIFKNVKNLEHEKTLLERKSKIIENKKLEINRTNSRKEKTRKEIIREAQNRIHLDKQLVRDTNAKANKCKVGPQFPRDMPPFIKKQKILESSLRTCYKFCFEMNMKDKRIQIPIILSNKFFKQSWILEIVQEMVKLIILTLPNSLGEIYNLERVNFSILERVIRFNANISELKLLLTLSDSNNLINLFHILNGIKILITKDDLDDLVRSNIISYQGEIKPFNISLFSNDEYEGFEKIKEEARRIKNNNLNVQNKLRDIIIIQHIYYKEMIFIINYELHSHSCKNEKLIPGIHMQSYTYVSTCLSIEIIIDKELFNN